MIRRIDLRGGPTRSERAFRSLVPRAQIDVESAIDAVRPICMQVKERGTAALLDFARRFDGVDLENIRVPEEASHAALTNLDPQIRAAVEQSITHVRRVHEAQLPRDATTTVTPGGTVTERWSAVERVGTYVPGGLAVYPSSVVMNVIPALTAGVNSVAVASPPQRDNHGLPHPTILATCALVGITEIYAVGGAQAIAMFAYGTGEDETACEPVDIVTGPGNIYVAAAKHHLSGQVGIDAIAGPTEIAIIADDSGDPGFIAADLVSQAEHDPLAASVLITPSASLADRVDAELRKAATNAKHANRIQSALGGEQSAIIITDDLDQAITVANAYGAEHLEIHTQGAADVAAKIRNAGAIFVGPWSPVSLGDYLAGSNHILPTGGSARYSSGLSVHSFLRTTQIVEYDQSALEAVSQHIQVLAEAEDLPAHGAAVAAREL